MLLLFLLILIFILTSLILLLLKYFIIAIIFSVLFTFFIIHFKLRINADDFRKIIEMNAFIDQQNTSNNNNNNDINMNVLSNMDRLRMLLSNEFDPNDFSWLNGLDQDNNESFIKGLTFDEIESIPTKILKTTINEQCTICLLKQEKNEEIRILPCNHQYHKECIDIWLNRRSHCPMCKTEAILRPISV